MRNPNHLIVGVRCYTLARPRDVDSVGDWLPVGLESQWSVTVAT